MKYWVIGGNVIFDRDEAIDASREYDNQESAD